MTCTFRKFVTDDYSISMVMWPCNVVVFVTSDVNCTNVSEVSMWLETSHFLLHVVTKSGKCG